MQGYVIEWHTNTIGVRKQNGECQCLLNKKRKEYNGIDFTHDIGTKTIECGNRTVHVMLEEEHRPIGIEERYSGPITNDSANDIIRHVKETCQPLVLFERVSDTNKARYYGRYIINRIVPTHRVTINNEIVDTFLTLFIVRIPDL